MGAQRQMLAGNKKRPSKRNPRLEQEFGRQHAFDILADRNGRYGKVYCRFDGCYYLSERGKARGKLFLFQRPGRSQSRSQAIPDSMRNVARANTRTFTFRAENDRRKSSAFRPRAPGTMA